MTQDQLVTAGDETALVSSRRPLSLDDPADVAALEALVERVIDRPPRA